MKLSQIDLPAVANAVTAILSERELSRQRQVEETNRAATELALRESADAARSQREKQQKLVTRLEFEQRNCHDRCEVLEKQYRDLPDRIVAERRRLNVLLGQLNDARKGL